MADTHNFQASYLHAVSRQIFMAVETPRHIADTVAGILVNGNLSGHDSHGVLRITSYLDMIANDRLRPKVEPEVIKETDNTFVVNAGFGFGHYTAQKSVELAIDKAKRFNVVCASLYDTSHIGRLGEYLEVAARAGCISIVTLGNGQRGAWPVVPFGGAVGGMSTNPIAIGCPTGDDSPFIADIATSVIAEGKLRVAQKQRRERARRTHSGQARQSDRQYNGLLRWRFIAAVRWSQGLCAIVGNLPIGRIVRGVRH